MNTVTLFSNGIGHFRRFYKVSSEETITIPFKTDYIGDVAASLQVFGKVRLAAPPSFTPANSNATSLTIDQSDALSSLLRGLSGAKVAVSPAGAGEGISGTLLGVETMTAELNGAVVKRSFVVVLTEFGIRKLSFEYMLNVNFTEESVRTEIEKALKNNFQKIKPDSTLLDLSLSPLDGAASAEAVVQYTIPVAAWKMRYAIREEKGNFSLEGAAIIDNNTDENWDNFQVSVVTGNPISFGTDIATVVVPKRKFVHLVDNVALGNVDVEESTSVMMAACASSEPRARKLASRGLGAKMSVSNRASFGMESMGGVNYCADEIAVAPEVESKDVGDFCVFTAKEPITLLARKSAVVPMFTVDLKHAGIVLLYKESNHASRPYRAVKFKNETEYSLGRGKTVIYNEGVFSGECVLDTAKPGENRMLPHCLENGVSIRTHHKQGKIERRSVRISDGVGYNELVNTAVTEYRIKNKKDETFKVALEHPNQLGPDAMIGFDGIEIIEQEKLSNGRRVYLELSPNQESTLIVTETFVDQQEIMLRDYAYIGQWISDGLPLLDNPQVKVCTDLQEQLDVANQDLTDANNRVSELTDQADRVRQNIGVTQQAPGHDTVSQWISDLDDTEKEIREITKTKVPQLHKRRKELLDQLRDALKSIVVTWCVDVPKELK
jgi:hypothetical protein